MFAVFADDWNLQDRLFPVAEAYGIPAVSVKNAICWQFADPDKNIMSRNQFFYDRYHPSNLGHTIMADCMLYPVKQVMDAPEMEDINVSNVKPVIGDAFTNVRLLNRKHAIPGTEIHAGSFDHTGGPKQLVERNMDLVGSPEFDYNWYYEGTEREDEFVPFVMKVYCREALLVTMDSNDPKTGKAVVSVDGKEVLTYDPMAIGWTHANAMIVMQEEEAAWHEIRVTMAAGDFGKNFTISGLGIAE